METRSRVFLFAGAIIPVLFPFAETSAPRFIDIAAQSLATFSPGSTISTGFAGRASSPFMSPVVS